MKKTLCKGHETTSGSIGSTVYCDGSCIKPTKRTKRPSMAMLNRWSNDGIAKATDGCKVEPDGQCPHGCNSWLLELGFI